MSESTRVKAFIARNRTLEPSIRESVLRWVALDERRLSSQASAGEPITRPVPLRSQQKVTRPGEKRSVFLPEEMLKEMLVEAKRRGISLSKLVVEVWHVSRDQISALYAPPP